MKRISLILMFLFLLSGAGVAQAETSTDQLAWGFKRGHDGVQAEAGTALGQMLEKHGGIYRGNASEKTLYLTFDNGYENGYTAHVLDVLKAKHVPATFFVTGHYLESAPDLAKRMVKEGHIIGNHSWSHPDFSSISDEKMKEELDRIKQQTFELTGQKEMKYLRTPRGTFSEHSLAYTKELGYRNVFWSVAYVDWETNNQHGKQYAYDNIMKQIHPGAIILLHSVSSDNAEALSDVITDLKKQGYQFQSLNKFR